MKKAKVLAVALASFGVLTLASTSVFAAEESKADIKLRDMGPDDKENPLIDPNDKEKEDTVYPGEEDNVVRPNGPLVIDYISRYHFGEVPMSGNNAIYNANLDTLKDTPTSTPFEVPNFIQVTDNRGTNAGWSLGVRMSQEFTTAKGVTLDNTSLTFKNTEMFKRSSNESAAPSVFSADKKVTISLANTGFTTIGAAKGTGNEGVGSWAVTHGHVVGDTAANAAESVQLFVPGKSTKVKGEAYTAKVEWLLTDEPGAATP
ncbi:WxL domain-containing protein [uncultured Vagococcus sp.]|uniref:WxL domain-containing protein n=1 Tax=uncultured Vagococcus sp. TaxID=189676 RepID=UPI0028D1B990|nr:WxL domain-containing protein [uncultured Vagococcus sp.]